MTRYIDVFNGDADGICSLIQLRLAEPKESKLITGVKRDINLLKQVTSKQAKDSHITVLDISFEKNSEHVLRLLQNGATIDYTDHHRTGELFKHSNLYTNINLDSNVCTALLVNNKLSNQFNAWAITGAFGDNLNASALSLAESFNYDESQISLMKQLGILINYNGYGEDLSDLYFEPAELFNILVQFETPFQFLADKKDVFQKLELGYKSDMDKALKCAPICQSETTAVFELPNEKWARRIGGVFGNQLANEYPDRAHAVIRKKADETYIVSVRAPLNNKQGADVLVSQFPSGGGRKAAAGINALPVEMLDDFIKMFEKQYQH
jgi:hypothetical protein